MVSRAATRIARRSSANAAPSFQASGISWCSAPVSWSLSGSDPGMAAFLITLTVSSPLLTYCLRPMANRSNSHNHLAIRIIPTVIRWISPACARRRLISALHSSIFSPAPLRPVIALHEGRGIGRPAPLDQSQREDPHRQNGEEGKGRPNNFPPGQLHGPHSGDAHPDHLSSCRSGRVLPVIPPAAPSRWPAARSRTRTPRPPPRGRAPKPPARRASRATVRASVCR